MKYLKTFNKFNIISESVDNINTNLYGYPSLEDVKSADYESILKWYRFLPSPGAKIPDSLSNEEFKEISDKQVEVMNLICDRYKEGGGFNSNTSKKIGWGN